MEARKISQPPVQPSWQAVHNPDIGTTLRERLTDPVTSLAFGRRRFPISIPFPSDGWNDRASPAAGKETPPALTAGQVRSAAPVEEGAKPGLAREPLLRAATGGRRRDRMHQPAPEAPTPPGFFLDR